MHANLGVYLDLAYGPLLLQSCLKMTHHLLHANQILLDALSLQFPNAVAITTACWAELQKLSSHCSDAAMLDMSSAMQCAHQEVLISFAQATTNIANVLQNQNSKETATGNKVVCCSK